MMSRCGWLLWLCVPLAACGDEGLGATGVQLTLIDSNGAMPAFVDIVVLGGDASIFRKRLPETGTLAPPTVEQPLGKVLVQLGGPFTGSLKVIARGMVDTMLVAEGAARVNVLPQTWHEQVILLGAGPLPDADQDGIPDVIDDCPQDATLRCGVRPDGGITFDPVDAGP